MLLSMQMESSLMRPLTDPKTSNIVDYTTISEGRSYTVQYKYKRDDLNMPQICSPPSKVGERIFFIADNHL